ncbi:hypothetical protein NC651_012161 [Populus alba x Populus x berolinensis]|nr:hypothetical protein NC651_012161 [Populus alba x Populus x berolinensis]
MHRHLDSHHLASSWCLPQVEFWICLLLTILGYIPGILFMLSTPSPSEDPSHRLNISVASTCTAPPKAVSFSLFL